MTYTWFTWKSCVKREKKERELCDNRKKTRRRNESFWMCFWRKYSSFDDQRVEQRQCVSEWGRNRKTKTKRNKNLCPLGLNKSSSIYNIALSLSLGRLFSCVRSFVCHSDCWLCFTSVFILFWWARLLLISQYFFVVGVFFFGWNLWYYISWEYSIWFWNKFGRSTRRSERIHTHTHARIHTYKVSEYVTTMINCYLWKLDKYIQATTHNSQREEKKKKKRYVVHAFFSSPHSLVLVNLSYSSRLPVAAAAAALICALFFSLFISNASFNFFPLSYVLMYTDNTEWKQVPR